MLSGITKGAVVSQCHDVNTVLAPVILVITEWWTEQYRTRRRTVNSTNPKRALAHALRNWRLRAIMKTFWVSLLRRHLRMSVARPCPTAPSRLY